MINKYGLKTIIKGVMILSICPIYLDLFNFAIANENPSKQTENQEETPKKNSLVGTEWQLINWTENEALSKQNSTIAFQKEALSGSGSCNRYTAGYSAQENSMKVGLIAATRKACSEEIMTQEILFLSALEGAKIYSINGKGDLQIAYIKQKEIGILTFKPISDENSKTLEKIVYISPKTVNCIGVSPQQCLQIKEKLEDNWTLFYGSIEGFEYEPGYFYELKIAQKKN